MKYGFFNAVQQSDGSYDREYDAIFFQRLIESVLYSAVPPDSFVVSSGQGLLDLEVSEGCGFVDGVFFYDDDTTKLTCSPANGVRTDLVIAWLDIGTRTVSLRIKEGTTIASYDEVALAKVYITGSIISYIDNIKYSRFVRNVPRITYGTGDPPSDGEDGDIYFKIAGNGNDDEAVG